MTRPPGRQPGPDANDPIGTTRTEFKQGGRKVMTISKAELDRREAAWKAEKEAAREDSQRSRK